MNGAGAAAGGNDATLDAGERQHRAVENVAHLVREDAELLRPFALDPPLALNGV